MRNITTPPPAGQPLPDDWKVQAPLRAKQATSDYLNRLQNAWRRPLTAQPPITSVYGSKDEDRTDGLSVVSESEEEVIYEDGYGNRVRKSKQ